MGWGWFLEGEWVRLSGEPWGAPKLLPPAVRQVREGHPLLCHGPLLVGLWGEVSPPRHLWPPPVPLPHPKGSCIEGGTNREHPVLAEAGIRCSGSRGL